MRRELVMVAWLVACSEPEKATSSFVDPPRDSGRIDERDAGRVVVPVVDGGEASDAARDPGCVPPDMLVALDRTGTMSRTVTGANPSDGPAYASAKFSIAIRALEALIVPPLDTTIRFGLELWPRRTAGCLTLAQKVTGGTPTNASCDAAEVLISPALSTGATIAATLDPATTPICTSTPTGRALIDAATHLATIKERGRDQYIFLVTDGADWDQTCPTPDPLKVTQDNARNGIKTFVLGFSAEAAVSAGGVGVPFLNDMACAGMTATDFAKNCRATSSGAYVAVDASRGPRLFQQATDSASLASVMRAVTTQVCCNCPR